MIALFPEIVKCARAKDIEKLAILVRLYFGRNEAKKPTINLRSLLSNFGIGIIDANLAYYGALLVVDEGGRFTSQVLLGRKLPIKEENFMLAHLLGHYLLDLQPKIASFDIESSGYREDESPIERYERNSYVHLTDAESEQEKIADQFAAEILLPRAMFSKAKEALVDSKKISTFFSTSEKCVERRCLDLTSVNPTMSIAKQVRSNNVDLYNVNKERPAISQEAPSSVSFSENTITTSGNNGLPSSQKTKKKPKNKSRSRGRGLDRIREIASKIDSSVER